MDSRDIRIGELEAENDELKAENGFLKQKADSLSRRLLLLQKALQEAEEGGGLSVQKHAGGRKYHNAEWENRKDQVISCMKAGMSPQKTMEQLGISRSTYYRFKNQFLRDSDTIVL